MTDYSLEIYLVYNKVYSTVLLSFDSLLDPFHLFSKQRVLENPKKFAATIENSLIMNNVRLTVGQRGEQKNCETRDESVSGTMVLNIRLIDSIRIFKKKR